MGMNLLRQPLCTWCRLLSPVVSPHSSTYTLLDGKRVRYAANTCTVQNASRGSSLPYLPHQLQGMKQYTTGAGVLEDRPGFFTRVWKSLGFTGKLRFNKHLMSRAGLRVYLCCVELIEYEEFFREFDLPDTFNSWFRITELHVWMAMVRLAREGRDGKFVRNHMMVHVWEDLDKRTKKLGQLVGYTARKEGIRNIADELKAALISYDEAALSDDTVLAGAMWRVFFQMQLDDMSHIEQMVHYVRKQLQHLDGQDSAYMLQTGLVTFLPLKGNTLNKKRTKPILMSIKKRV